MPSSNPKPTNEQLTEKYRRFTEKGGPLHGLFTVDAVHSCNFKVDGLQGHPFTIGPEHVTHASDHCEGILGQETIDVIPCAHEDHPPRYGHIRPTKCGRPAHTHTHDIVLFVKLVRNLGNKEAADALFAIKPDMIADGVAGVGFLNMGKGFDIAPPDKSAVDEKGGS